MKTAVFLTGNFWLLAGLILILGRHGDYRWTFLGVSAWYHPLAYGLITFCCFLVGIWQITAARKERE